MVILLVLYMLSGVIKNAYVLFGIPSTFDITLVIGLLLLGLGAVNFSFGRVRIAFSRQSFGLLSLLLVFLLWVGFSMFLSESTSYKYQKLFGIGTGLLLIAIPLLYRQLNIDRYVLLYIGITLFGAWFYLFVMARYSLFENFYDVSGMYLYFGKMLGTGTLFLIYGWRKVLGWTKPKAFLIIAICAFTMLALGARGPFVFFVVTIILVTIVHLVLRQWYIRKFAHSRRLIFLVIGGILGVIAVALVLFISEDIFQLVQRSFNRFILLFNFLDVSGDGDGGKSINDRVEFLAFAVEGIHSNIYHYCFGHGFGSFGLNYRGVETPLYPHNLFLEAWYELGLIGLILLVALLIYAFWLASKSPLGFMIIPAIVFELLNFLKSGSFGDVRTLFLLFVLALGFSYHQLGFKDQAYNKSS